MGKDVVYLQELLSNAKDGFEKYKPSFDKLNSAYLLNLEQEQITSLAKRNKSRIYIPKINAKAKRISDSLSETYFNNDTFAKLQTYINSKQEVIDKWQEALDIYTDMLKLYNTFAPIFQKIPFLGTSVAKVYWSGDMPIIEEIELDEIYFDPNAKSPRDVRYIVNKLILTADDLLALAKRKIFKKEQVLLSLDDIEFKPYERFEVYDIYEQINGEWEVSTLFNETLLREGIKLKDGQPFIFGYMTPQVRDFNEQDFVCVYGEPPLASILPLQDEINITRNSIIDGINMALKPKIVVNTSANVTREQIETIGLPIFTNEPTALQVLPAPNLNVAQLAVSLIDQEMSEASGVSPQQNGASTYRKETATMASIMANEGSVRIQGYIRTFNETFFEPIFERLAKLVWKYGNADFFAGYSRDEIPSFAVSLNTGIGALNKEVQKQGLMEAMGAIGNQLGVCLQLQDMEGAMQLKKANGKILR
ncbi:bacteriophage head to tail connecting protein [Campylobacter pinnipediorum subsp. caledonicus]|uniref:Bacteriophage head to tail connecting protein n=1 Tax=Campylobacter pinnipediorum subsp. caledonicus TaxID=1874362 RepID=A0A1S6U666_9BACT|nr:phage head-tail adapter protein [Campylobacter pinnipediorum]AQW87165.1 bacteriophage head to tail connecting protein [Campylobacter pinnipediorum subsp. caledonicus]